MTPQEEIENLKLEIARLKDERKVFRQLVQDSYKALLNGIGGDDEDVMSRLDFAVGVGDSVMHPVNENCAGIVRATMNQGKNLLVSWSNGEEGWIEQKELP